MAEADPSPERRGASQPGWPELVSVLRASTLFGLIGASLVLSAQLAAGSDWLAEFLRTNQLLPAQRTLLIRTMVGGGLLAALVATAAALRQMKAGGDPRGVERAAWVASPLALAAFLPVLLRHEPWLLQPVETLALMLLFLWLVERSVAASLGAAAWSERAAARLAGLLGGRADLVAQLVVWAAVAGYAAFMGHFTVMRLYKLEAHNYDLGLHDNLVASALDGAFIDSLVFSGFDGPDFLACHASFGAYLFVPLYALYPHAETLLVAQAILIGLTAVPLWHFARRRLSTLPSTLIALAWVAYYPIHGANFHDVTFLPMAAPFVMTAIWAADARRPRIFLLAFLAALSMREDVPIGLTAAGGVLLFSGHRPGYGLAMLGGSAAYFFVVRMWLMTSVGNFIFPRMVYGELLAPGDPPTFGSILRTLLSNPAFVFAKVVTAKKVAYLLGLFAPLALLPLRRTWLLPALVPGIVATLLSTNYDPVVEMGFQYTMHWAPLLMAAVPLALASIGAADASGPARRRAALAALVAGVALTSFHLGAFPRRADFKAGFGRFDFEFSEPERRRFAEVMALVRRIPDRASVSTSETVGPLVTNRRLAYSLREGTQGAEYVLFARNEIDLMATRPALAQGLRSGEYGVLARRGGFALLRRGHATGENAKLMKEWGL